MAAEWMGWKNIVSCEINDFGNKVLGYYWPDAYHHRDIHTLNYQLINEELTKRYGQEWRSNDIILTGGFPCQPYSVAGKRLGKEDDRHLWPEMLRVISEIKPTYVVGENVSGLLSWNGGLVFDEVRADLETQGYEVAVFVLPAAGVNAPHKRERVWFVALNASNAKNAGFSPCFAGQRQKQFGGGYKSMGPRQWDRFPTQPAVCSRNDGVFAITHGIAIQENRKNMDRNLVTKLCLEEGRLKVDFLTGKIYSLKQRGKEGKEIELLGSDCNGYIVHTISYNGFKIQLRAHQIVWIAANGVYDKSNLMIDHINRNKKDNRLENLRLVDAKGNRENATKYNGKLTNEQKDMIVSLYKEDGIPIRELAEDFGISKSRVHQIIKEHNGLYGITFLKWRNETIKAGGNAIVPQVAFEIFKAIEKTHFHF